MTDKVTLSNVSSFQNDSSAVATVNANMAAITTAVDNTLSRDGTSPNQMGASLDMNSNHIINLPAPASPNEPLRLADTIAAIVNGSIVSGVTNGVGIGVSSTSLTTTAALTNGQLVVGQTGSSPLPKTITGDVTITNAGVTAVGSATITGTKLASNTVGYSNLVTAVQSTTFNRLAKTSNYTVLNADKGSNIALGGSAFYTLTFSAASGYDANFAVTVLNEDAGRGKTIACSGLSNFFLWPGQTAVIYNSNNVWQVQRPFRWTNNSITVFVDPVNGASTNDGLAAGAGGAINSVTNAYILIKNNFDCLGSVATIQLANGTYTESPAIFGGEVGCYDIVIGGATGQTASVIWTGIISCKDFIALQIQNMTFSGAGSGIVVNQNGIIDIESTVTFGNAPGAVHMTAGNGGVINLNTGYTISGGSVIDHFFVTGTGRVQGGSGTINVTGALACSGFFAQAAYNGLIDTSGITISGTGVAGSTGTRYNAILGGGINTNGGGASYFPGNAGGTATSPGWYA